MKRGTPDHWKMVDLAHAADVPVAYGLPWANGVMERIWHFAAQYAPAGDIGRIPNRAIARLCAWPESKADALVTALVDSKWLDRDAVFGLVIHDWRDHCEDSVHSRLARNLQYFTDGMPPRITGLRRDEVEKARLFYVANPTSTPAQPRHNPGTTPTDGVCNGSKSIASALASAIAIAPKEEKTPSESKRKKRTAVEIPVAALPEEWAAYPMQELGWTRQRADSVFESMRFWAKSKAATYVDWKSAYQGWCRRETEKTQAGNLFQPKPPARNSAEAIVAAIERDHQKGYL